MKKTRVTDEGEVVVINEHGEKALEKAGGIDKVEILAAIKNTSVRRLLARAADLSPADLAEALEERNRAAHNQPSDGPRTRQRFDVDTAWFKDRLDGAGMSMRTLAKHIGLDVSAVSLMLNGRRKMTVQEAGAIASQLDASVEEVLRRAGVDDLGVRDNLVEIVGWVDADGTVNKGQGKGPTEVKGPGVEGLRGLWVAAGRWAGWVLMYKGAKALVLRFSVVLRFFANCCTGEWGCGAGGATTALGIFCVFFLLYCTLYFK